MIGEERKNKTKRERLTRSILSVRLNGVATQASSTKVGLLEVSRLLVESVPVEQIMNLVVRVEKLGSRRLDVSY